MEYAIFDFDGTLVDSMQFWRFLGRYYLEDRGIEADEESIRVAEENGFSYTAEFYKNKYGFPETTDEIAEGIKKCLRAGYKSFSLKPGVMFFLKLLKERGVKMCIATGTNKSMAEETAKRLGIRDYFEFIISCDEVGAWKNNPLVFEKALERLGGNKENTLVFEDSPEAVRTATGAGFKTVGIADEFSFSNAGEIKRLAAFYTYDYEKDADKIINLI